jgi:prepilin-type N-terminal cleavage/methylation domain-containing protein
MRTQPPSRRTAFTLIELLVVITIVGLLVAVLMPAINGALKSGKRKTVENNMRQLGTGMQMSANANNDLMPNPHNGTMKPAWTALTSAPDTLWVNAAAAALDSRTGKEYATLSDKRPFYSSSSLFAASGARYPASKLATPEWAFGMNLNLQEADGSQMKISSLSKVSSKVLFAEGGMVGEDKPQGYSSQTFAGNIAVEAKNFVTRYNNIGCIGFIDGHVAGHTAKDVLNTSTTSIEWTP